MHSDGVIRSKEDAEEWLPEALSRLDTEMGCIRGHLDQLDDLTLGEDERAAHWYSLLRHLENMGNNYVVVHGVVAQWLAPKEVIEHIAVENIERATGQPLKIVERMDGLGILVVPDDEIPDDLSGLGDDDSL